MFEHAFSLECVMSDLIVSGKHQLTEKEKKKCFSFECYYVIQGSIVSINA